MQTERKTPVLDIDSAHLRGFYRAGSGDVHLVDSGSTDLIQGALGDENGLLWLDLYITDPSHGTVLSEIFRFHPLTIEDAVEPRVDAAKIDDYGEYIFIVMQALTAYTAGRELSAVEVDFYLGRNYVVSCHQQPVPALDSFLERCHRGDQAITHRPDWILHGLMDAIVDEYLPIVDAVDETIDDLETRILHRANTELLEQILIVKRTSLRLRRATGPQREIVNRLSRGEFERLVGPETAIYFRDIYNHLVRVEYLVEALRDLADGALQTYLSVVSNRLNEIMKVLTAAATIFLPLTVITGIYGMNFEENQFPSFSAPWGFAAVVVFMLVNSLMMLAYFRHRRWV